MKTETIKSEIKKSYGNIAKGKTTDGCCNDTACCTNDNLTSMTEDYSKVEGYHKEADLALGAEFLPRLLTLKKATQLLTLARALEMTCLFPEELLVKQEKSSVLI